MSSRKKAVIEMDSEPFSPALKIQPFVAVEWEQNVSLASCRELFFLLK